MPVKVLRPSFVALLLVIGLVTLGFAGPKKQGNDQGPAAAGTGQTDGGKHKSKKSALPESHQPIDPSQYVGAETCKTCHEDVAKGYDKGPHWKTTLAKHQGRNGRAVRRVTALVKNMQSQPTPARSSVSPACQQRNHPNAA